MNRVDRVFKKLKIEKRPALIAFLTSGYPNLAATEKLVLSFERSGVDIVELGVPFSDPIADGPVIQAASYEALKKGTTLTKVLELVKRLRRSTEIPLCAMTYFNLILSYGPERFARDAAAVGLDAVIVPDLPPHEEKGFERAAIRAKLHVIRFISPATSAERSRMIVRNAKGFIYFVSLTGVTGARKALPEGLGSQLRQVRRIAKKIPVCVGFGVGTPEQVRSLKSSADGIIVGSAIVRRIRENVGQKDMVAKVSKFVATLAREVR
jgi:tryptophan synthase alpha chain